MKFIQTPQANPRRKEPEFVSIHLLLLRLKEQGTDILITINVPHYPGEYVKAAAGEPTQLMKDGEATTKRILDSFNIKDWTLFNAWSLQRGLRVLYEDEQNETLFTNS